MASSQNKAVHKVDINNHTLIKEIEKRPALFDKTSKEYSDMDLRMKFWEDITQMMFSNAWDNLSPQQKSDASRLVQKRWKNLRASFSRELRRQKVTKCGQAARERHYKYFDELLFLVPSMTTRDKSGNSDIVEATDCEEDDDVPQRSEYSRKRKKEIVPYEDRLLDILNTKRFDDNKFIEAVTNNRSRDDDDREKHFALSLVPLLKAVPEENKLEVQIRILKIFQDVQKQRTK